MADDNTKLQEFLSIIKDAHNTTDILLAYSKMRLPKGKELEKTDPLLRKFTSQDLQIAGLLELLKTKAPNLDTDIEKADRIFSQAKKVTDANVKPLLDLLNADYEKAKIEGIEYMNQRRELRTKMKSLAKELLSVVNKILDK